MTIVEAFQQCGPCRGAADDAARSAAATVIYDEVQSLSRRLIRSDVRDDCSQTVLLRLIRVGPRGIRSGDPDTEAGVRGYLGRALKNARRDQAKAAFQSADDEPEPSVVPAEPEELWPREAIACARAVLDDICVPGCAASLRSDARIIFERVVADRRTMADGGLDFDEVVQRHRGELTNTTRNAVYKEQSRALGRLGGYIENYITSNQLLRIDAEALRIVFAELCGWDT